VISPVISNGARAEVRQIRAEGFSAWVDACAQSAGEIWLLSMLGNQQSVRAIWARLVKGEVAYLAENEHASGSQCWLAREAWGTWRFFKGRLPSGSATHGMLLPELASYAAEKRDFLLLPRSEAEAPSLHYRFLNRRLDLPLHPSWAGWLWERGLDTEEAEPLEAFGLLAYRCRPNPERLREDLTAALRRGILAVSDPTRSRLNEEE
jgi:hypothetical protein